MVYFLLYVVGLSEMRMTICTSIISFGGIIVIAILMKVVEKFDKAKVYSVLVMFSGIVMIIFNFIDGNILIILRAPCLCIRTGDDFRIVELLHILDIHIEVIGGNTLFGITAGNVVLLRYIHHDTNGGCLLYTSRCV